MITTTRLPPQSGKGWLVEQGLTSHSTQFRSLWTGDDVLQVWWPNQQCQNTEVGWLVIQTSLSVSRLTSPCHNNTTHAHIIQENNLTHTKKSKHSEWTKSGIPSLWAGQMIVQLRKATQYHYYRIVRAIFPKIIAQMWSNGVWGKNKWQIIT